MIHKDVYRDWKNHPVTEGFFQEVGDIVKAIEDAHLEGASIDSHARMAKELGLILAYKSVLGYSPDFNEDGYMLDENGDILE